MSEKLPDWYLQGEEVIVTKANEFPSERMIQVDAIGEDVDIDGFLRELKGLDDLLGSDHISVYKETPHWKNISAYVNGFFEEENRYSGLLLGWTSRSYNGEKIGIDLYLIPFSGEVKRARLDENTFLIALQKEYYAQSIPIYIGQEVEKSKPGDWKVLWGNIIEYSPFGVLKVLEVEKIDEDRHRNNGMKRYYDHYLSLANKIKERIQSVTKSGKGLSLLTLQGIVNETFENSKRPILAAPSPYSTKSVVIRKREPGPIQKFLQRIGWKK